jgi:hypothetical protein
LSVPPPNCRAKFSRRIALLFLPKNCFHILSRRLGTLFSQLHSTPLSSELPNQKPRTMCAILCAMLSNKMDEDRK